MNIYKISKHIFTGMGPVKRKKFSICMLNIYSDDKYFDLKITDKQMKSLIKHFKLVIETKKETYISYVENKNL